LLKPTKFQRDKRDSKQTPRYGVVVALLVGKVLGRTSTTVGNQATLFYA